MLTLHLRSSCLGAGPHAGSWDTTHGFLFAFAKPGIIELTTVLELLPDGRSSSRSESNTSDAALGLIHVAPNHRVTC